LPIKCNHHLVASRLQAALDELQEKVIIVNCKDSLYQAGPFVSI
jgi:hypothetical protein